MVRRPAAVSKSLGAGSRTSKSAASAAAPKLVAFQIYLQRNRKPFAFSRIWDCHKVPAENEKRRLIERWEDETWSSEHLRREFRALVQKHRE